jgi:hypothetical protein
MDLNISPKFPRIYHLPFSSVSNEDKVLSDVSTLLNVPLVITEKLDGSNVCLERQGCYARSHSTPPKHPSFNAFKALHAQLRHSIPSAVQLFGEWLWCRHLIEYNQLPGYFMLFAVRDKNSWLSWKSVRQLAGILRLPTVPVMEQRRFETEQELRGWLEQCYTRPLEYGTSREGFVIRHKGSFDNARFSHVVAKWVSPEFAEKASQIDEHWTTKDNFDTNNLRIGL